MSDLTPLSGLAKLGQLDCSFTRVSDLMPLSGLAQLQHLDCSTTLVIDLTPLSGLAKLQLLDCGSTSVSDLVPLSGLGQLQLLNCSLCRLGALPAFIRENAKLTLIAFNARVPGLPHGVLSRNYDDDCRARVKAHYDDLAKGAADLTDVKLLLLGNGGAGKTQIARWLAGAAFETEWDSTHGIQIVIQAQPGSIAARLHLQMWDFGGQDIYHGTHVMFLRGPAVLMPIWAKDRENRETYDYGGLTFRNHPLAYWIDVVKHQASEASPALIVQSKCDQKQDEERRFPVSEDALKALPYATELHVSPKTDRGRGALEDALQDAILWLRDPDRLGVPQIGAGRLRVQRRLEAMRDADSKLPREQRIIRLLERQDFDAICAEEGVSSPECCCTTWTPTAPLFYRPGLFGRIVLDQSWALEAIYAVFDRKRVYSVLCNDEGRFSRAKLGLLVWQEHSDDEQKLLLSMMVSCGICFEHRRFSGTDDANTEYIAPDMLADRETVAGRLASRWAEDRPGAGGLSLRFAAWRTDPLGHGRNRRGRGCRRAVLARRLVRVRYRHAQPIADRGGNDRRLARRDPHPHPGRAGCHAAAKGDRGDRGRADSPVAAANGRGTSLTAGSTPRAGRNFAGAGETEDGGMVCVVRLGR